jgi:hypothetical protein
MLGLGDNSDSRAIEMLFDQVGDAMRHPFLNLRSAGDFFDNSRQFAQSGDSTIWNIGHVNHTAERQEMMLTHAREGNVPNQNHFVVILFKRLAGSDRNPANISAYIRAARAGVSRRSSRSGSSPTAMRI